MKKSFWKRCNRGFVVSMALLIVVVLYVTVTQIMLMGQKRDIRDVCESVDALLAQHAQMSADQLAELKQEAPRKAFEEAVREKLKPFFVKDAAYLSEAVTSYVNTVVGLADNEMSFTSLKDDDKDDSIRIDEDTAAVCALGGAGVISVAANIVPREMHRLVELCLADRILEAGREQLRLAPLIRALFCEVNPIPVKTAMARMGLCSNLLRLPLCEMSEENRARLFAAMDACGVSA